MHNALRSTLRATAVALALSGAGACDDRGAEPIEPVPGVVLLDTSSTIPAVAGARDTIDVDVPDERTMGVIIETNVPIRARYGPGQFDLIWSGFGGAFAAIVPQAGTGGIRLFVQRSEPAVVQADYRMRIIAVDEAPEHAEQGVETGSAFRREWIDPPLDLDVFVIDFDEGDRFYVEAESGDADTQVTMGLLPPAGASFYAFLATGPGRARSDVFETAVPGEHLLIVYSAGLTPDVELAYRFRIVETDEPATTILR